MGRLTTIAALCVLLSAFALHAQDLLLTGHVVADSAKPLQYAAVSIEGYGRGVVTDPDGKYAFLLSATRVNGQTANLTARLIGFKSTSVPIVLSGTTIEHDFTLAVSPVRIPPDYVTPQQPYTTTSAAVLDGHFAILRAAGLHDLRTNHKGGEREIRIWRWNGRAYALYRIVERKGHVRGDRIDYHVWYDSTRRATMRDFEMYFDSQSCTHTTSGAVLTCRVALQKDIDWRELGDELDSASTWEYSSEDMLTRPFLVNPDEGNLETVELWNGVEYTAWLQLGNARSSEDQERTDAIWRVVSAIDANAPRRRPISVGVSRLKP